MRRSDLEEKLDEQIKLLQSACESYDQGNIVEALNIASRLRVILHDTRSSYSALGLLEIKDKIKFYDTTWIENFENIASYLGIIFIRSTPSGSVYIPYLDDFPHTATWINFSNWWQKIVIRDQRGQTFSRKDIVLDIANKDGGSHIDEDVPEEYSSLKNNSVRIYTDKDGTIEDIPHIHLATCRQIAHECLKSIENFQNGN